MLGFSHTTGTGCIPNSHCPAIFSALSMYTRPNSNGFVICYSTYHANKLLAYLITLAFLLLGLQGLEAFGLHKITSRYLLTTAFQLRPTQQKFFIRHQEHISLYHLHYIPSARYRQTSSLCCFHANQHLPEVCVHHLSIASYWYKMKAKLPYL